MYDESSMCGMCVYIYSLFFNIFINGNLFSLLFYNLLCIAFKWKIVKYFLTIINCTTSFNIYCGSYTTLTLEKCNVQIIFTTNLKWYVIGFNVDSLTSNNMLPNFANWLGGPRLESNIVRKLRTTSGILLTGLVDSFDWVLFLWDHINHSLVAKISGTRGFVSIRTTKS